MYEIGVLASFIINKYPEEYIYGMTSQKLSIIMYLIQREFCVVKKQVCFHETFNVWGTGVSSPMIRQCFGRTTLPLQKVNDSFLFRRINEYYLDDTSTLIEKIDKFEWKDDIDAYLVNSVLMKFGRYSWRQLQFLISEDVLYQKKYGQVEKNIVRSEVYINEEDMLEAYAKFVFVNIE